MRYLARIAAAATSIILLVVGMVVLWSQGHGHNLDIRIPVGISSNIDAPFHVGCARPDIENGPRANATILVLARNDDAEGVAISVASLENRFNKWFHYPYTFLNNEEFSAEFRETVANVTSSKVEYGVIKPEHWEFPDNIKEEWVTERLDYQEDIAIPYGRQKSYHQMCRFFSGKFYHHELVQKYKWYWRLEPDVEFFCDVPYDVFKEMEAHDKVYGFNIIIGDHKGSVENLFRHTQAFKHRAGIPDTDIWNNLIKCPRKSGTRQPGRLMNGCDYSLCHFWDNFEIAQFDLWRTPTYEAYFKALEDAGGFWYERWGDAPVHSLGVALQLNASQVHYFRDIGYQHTTIGHCPGNTPGHQLPDDNDNENSNYTDPIANGVGCRCTCAPGWFPGVGARESEYDGCFKSYAKMLGLASANQY